MSVADLTGTTWLINSSYSDPSSTIWKSINFTSNSMSFDAITIYDDMDNEQTIAYRGAEEFPTIVYSWGWTNEAYRTIVITGGTDATDQTLIAWLEANASNVTPASPDVVISYNNTEIATMSESGTKTLETEGTFCTGDIVVSYTKSGGGGGSSSDAYDLIIKCNGAGFTNVASDYQIVKGSLATILAAKEQNTLITGVCHSLEKYYDDDEDVTNDIYSIARLCAIDDSYSGQTYPGWSANAQLIFIDFSNKKRVVLVVNDEETILSVHITSY